MNEPKGQTGVPITELPTYELEVTARSLITQRLGALKKGDPIKTTDRAYAFWLVGLGHARIVRDPLSSSFETKDALPSSSPEDPAQSPAPPNGENDTQSSPSTTDTGSPPEQPPAGQQTDTGGTTTETESPPAGSPGAGSAQTSGTRRRTGSNRGSSTSSKD